MCNIRMGCGKEESVNSALVHNMTSLSGSCTPSFALVRTHVLVSLLN